MGAGFLGKEVGYASKLTPWAKVYLWLDRGGAKFGLKVLAV